MPELRAGMDFRDRTCRREVWHRLLTFHTRHHSHPGGLYYGLPALADAAGWSPTQRAWAAFLWAHTADLAVVSVFTDAAPYPHQAHAALALWERCPVGTPRLDLAIHGYLARVGPDPDLYWQNRADDGWDGVWSAASTLPRTGHSTAWRLTEALNVLGVIDTIPAELELAAPAAHRYRAGLLLLLGYDEWTARPDVPSDLIAGLAEDVAWLYGSALRRNPAGTVNLFTVVSALEAWWGWHLGVATYPAAGNDVLHRQLRAAEQLWGDRFEVLWEARRLALPPALRLEDNPNDPGPGEAKQEHYLRTGQVVVMDLDWPEFANDFARGVTAGRYGTRSPA